MKLSCLICWFTSQVVEPTRDGEGKPFFRCPHCLAKNLLVRLRRQNTKPDQPPEYTASEIELEPKA